MSRYRMAARKARPGIHIRLLHAFRLPAIFLRANGVPNAGTFGRMRGSLGGAQRLPRREPVRAETAHWRARLPRIGERLPHIGERLPRVEERCQCKAIFRVPDYRRHHRCGKSGCRCAAAAEPADASSRSSKIGRNRREPARTGRRGDSLKTAVRVHGLLLLQPWRCLGPALFVDSVKPVLQAAKQPKATVGTVCCRLPNPC